MENKDSGVADANPAVAAAGLALPNIQNRLAAVISQFKETSFTTSAGMHYDGQTKFLSHHFPADSIDKFKTLELLLLTDVQYGHVCCRADKFKEYIDWVLARPQRFVFLGGDMIDAWRAGSPGDSFDNLFRADGQFYRFLEAIAPLRHRILGFVGGNHERRGLAGGLDWGGLIAMCLQIPYSAGAQLISIFYGEHNPLKVYLWHGRGSARTAGARVNMTLSVVPNDEAQVYLSGHIHWPHLYPGWHVRRNHATNAIDAEKYYVVSASSFLEFYGSYGEVAGYTYSGLMMPLVRVGADGSYRVEM